MLFTNDELAALLGALSVNPAWVDDNPEDYGMGPTEFAALQSAVDTIVQLLRNQGIDPKLIYSCKYFADEPPHN